jgi:H+/Cl- antiporter ClcA
VSVAADLQAPDLSSAGGADGGAGLGWIGWLALLLLVAGAVAGALLFRRFRQEQEPAEA